MSSWRDKYNKPSGYPHNDWPQSVWLERAEQHIKYLEAENERLRMLIKSAKGWVVISTSPEYRNKMLLEIFATALRGEE